MERLTDTCWRNLDPWECCGQDHYCQRGCHDEGGCTNGCIVPNLYDRLAAYEDTGLPPEEIKRLLDPSNDPLTLDELREMDGEPVWIGPWKLWGLVSASDEAIATCGYGRFPFCLCKNSIYNNIYRRKPEEA